MYLNETFLRPQESKFPKRGVLQRALTAEIRRTRCSATCSTWVTGTYVVCLDCGKEFPYDWSKMKVLSAAPEEAETERIASRAETGFAKVA